MLSLNNGMINRIASADVIIINELSKSMLAIVVGYDEHENIAPTVIAKGKDDIGLQIKDIGAKYNITIVLNPSLADRLYSYVDVGHYISEDMFIDIAEILAYSYKNKNNIPLL